MTESNVDPMEPDPDEVPEAVTTPVEDVALPPPTDEEAEEAIEVMEEAADIAARSHGNPAVVHDHQSELVDTDPAHDTGEVPDPPSIDKSVLPEKPLRPAIHYSFSGANMGGESLMMCDRCSALMKESSTDGHTKWHDNGSV